MTRHPAVIVDRDRNGTGARHVGAFSSDVCIVVSPDTRTSVVLLAGMPHPSARWPPVAIRLNTMPATSCSKHLFDRARRREHRRRMVVTSRGGERGSRSGAGVVAGVGAVSVSGDVAWPEAGAGGEVVGVTQI